MASSAGKTMDFEHAICRIVEDTSGHERLKYFGPGCLVKFANTEFLNSVGTPRSNYFLVASNQVLRKDLLGILQKKSEPSVVMIAEFQRPGVRGKLERIPLNELYSSLEDDVFEQAGIIYVTLTKLRASRFRKRDLSSRALEGRFCLMTSDELRCIVLYNERTINREERDMGEVSTKVYDLRRVDQGAYMFHWSRFPNYCLRNEEGKVFTTEDEFQSFDGEPLGSIILTRDAKFVGVLNFIEKQPAPAFVGSGFGTAASVRHDIPEREMHAGASGGSYPLLDPELKSEVESETEIWKVTAQPAATPLTRNHFGVVVNGEGELQEKKDFANGNKSPMETSYRSSHFNSLANKVEQDLEGEVLVVDLPPENGSKEMPASVEPEQRAHANNSTEEPSLQDPEEQLRDLYNDLRVQATNNENDSSVQDSAEHLRDQDDDANVHRRNNDGPLSEAPGGETDDYTADPNDVLLQTSSGASNHNITMDRCSGPVIIGSRNSLATYRSTRKSVAQDSVKPVSMASGSQLRELIDLTSEQEGTWQQVPPAAAAAPAHKNVSESIVIQETTSPSTQQLSVNKRKGKRQPPDLNHQENLPLGIMSGYECTFWEEISDTEQSEGTVSEAATAGDALSGLVLNANQQGHLECLLQRGKEELASQPLHPIGGSPQQDLSLVQKRQNDSIVHAIADPASHDSLKPVSMASGSQLRALIDQISEQDATWHQVPPAAAAAAAAHKNVSESTFIQEIISPSTEKLSENERKRKRQCHDHNQQENVDLDQLLLDFTCDNECTFPEESSDTAQSEDILADIYPNEGSIKGGDRFFLTLSGVVPVEIESFKAIFQGSEVYLEKTIPFTFTGKIPGSQCGPGKVRVTLMSSDESWWGGECDFRYIKDPPTDEGLLSKVVKDRDMCRMLLHMIDKKMSNSKPSDLQTSDSFGKTVPERKIYGTKTQFKKIKL